MTLILGTLVLAAAAAQAGGVNPQAAALEEFQKRTQAYLELKKTLNETLDSLAPTASATELRARQQALAAALRNARRNAKPGDLIPQAVQEQIRATVKADMQRRAPAAKQAALEEVPAGPLPGINRSYPEEAALPTVPALLLANLPRLPDNLQYRFFGRHMVILDGDVEIVVDYVANAVPR